jgi:predicted NAD-dependent protein-ADP-ribosyltransferase YbiA (DUF1768 family)
MDVEPDRENADKPGFFGPRFFLSNFYEKHPLLFGCYGSNEAFYQAMKTVDHVERGQFMYPCEPGPSKKLGRAVTLRPDWELIKDDVMAMGLAEKFAAGSPLGDRLRDLVDAHLEETNYWHDNYWGNCTCGAPRCERQPGTNMLGKLLMERRRVLRNV